MFTKDIENMEKFYVELKNFFSNWNEESIEEKKNAFRNLFLKHASTLKRSPITPFISKNEFLQYLALPLYSICALVVSGAILRLTIVVTPIILLVLLGLSVSALINYFSGHPIRCK